ncbi:LysR family transcriptional regulator [Neptunicoccus cionae]|uniref:LysR family transcriptional regulator n=1 Tax=Neptunicoccus cionae TaxID=2035344 RepID=UPI000C78859E|nr:LysR family transcriptional regulator [Amylibacter cionae]PLS22004.1 LysR family transcriptional regulator [Amylibacter cionae]
MVDTPGKLSLWAIEVFIAAVEEGSVSNAAKRLSASISSVSQQLTNLETALGASLLDRSTRPQQLTPAGGLFLKRAQSILSEANQAKAELAVYNFSQMSRLRLGLIEDFDAEVTPALMEQLAGALKGCQFLLESASSYTLTDALDSRALDLVVVADLNIAEKWMQVHSLMQEPFVAVAPKGYVDQAKPVFEQLEKLPFVRYSSRQMMGRQIEAHLSRQRINLPNRFEFGSYHAILSMVASGRSWSVTTPLGYMSAQRFHGALDVMPLPFKALTRSISLIARQGEMDSIAGDVAALMRPLIRKKLMEPCLQKFPWMGPDFRVE